jgi:peptidoglycan hydrolase-like protein with peptidoglycan-binding domain
MINRFTGRFTSSEAVTSDAVLYLKKSLNRLGYYSPLSATGITPIPDKSMVDALKHFQANHKLAPTGVIKEGDDTARLLKTENEQLASGFYMWRTVNDQKVRAEHAVYNGTVRAWSDAPDPGEDYNCRCWAESVEAPVLNDRYSRETSILKNKPAVFDISVNPNANDTSPLYESKLLANLALVKFDKMVEDLSKKHNIDSDLVRAIMWSEHARGAYWGFGYVADATKQSNTLMPMNINSEIWGSLIQGDLYAYDNNIEAGIILLKRIRDRIEKPTIAKIAAIWHYIGLEKTNNYAHYVERIYKEKPWKK